MCHQEEKGGSAWNRSAENEGGRKGGTRDNCIRKKRGPKGRKWLEEKGLISDREKESWRRGWAAEEGSLTARRSIHTDTLCVNTQTRFVCLCVCVCVCVCALASTGLLILVQCPISLVPSTVSEERSRQSHLFSRLHRSSWTSRCLLQCPVTPATELFIYFLYVLTLAWFLCLWYLLLCTYH